MDKKQLGLFNLKIHYIWTFFSSFLFLSPIMWLFYKYHWLSVNDIIFISSIYTFFVVFLELPTSTLGDSIWRVRVLKYSILSSYIPLLIYFFIPTYFWFYVAIFFSALWNALWSGTWHAKLQEDLEAAWKEKEFWKVIWRLISLERLWRLVTPIVIFLVLKYYNNWYNILAWLDVVCYIIAIYFVFQFKEIDCNNITSDKSYKEKMQIQIDIFKSGFSHLFRHKWLLNLIIILILANDLNFIWRILLPTLSNNWVKDFISSQTVWIATFAWIIWSYISHKITDKIWLNKTLIWIIIFNFVFHLGAYFYFDNNILLIIFYTWIVFCTWLIAPTWNHLLMNFSNIKEKATVRSLFLMIIWFFEFLFLLAFSLISVKLSILIITIMMFFASVFWYFKLRNN